MADSKSFYSALGAIGKMCRTAMAKGPENFDPDLFRQAIENRMSWVMKAYNKHQEIRQQQRSQQVLNLSQVASGFRNIGEMLNSSAEPEEVTSFIAAQELVELKKKEFEEALRAARAQRAKLG